MKTKQDLKLEYKQETGLEVILTAYGFRPYLTWLEERLLKIQEERIPNVGKTIELREFPSKKEIRNMALDIIGYDKDQPQLITQEMAVNFITIFAKWMRDKLKANG